MATLSALDALERLVDLYAEATGDDDARITATLRQAALDVTNPEIVRAIRLWLSEKTPAPQPFISDLLDATRKAAELAAQERRDKAKAELQAELATDAPDADRLMQAAKAYSTPAQGQAGIPLDPIPFAEIQAKLKRKANAYKSKYLLNDTDPLTFPSGAVSFIAAPSGHGKTTLLFNLLADAAIDDPTKKNWLFSYEEADTDAHIKAALALLATSRDRMHPFLADDALYSADNLSSLTDYLKTGSVEYIARDKRNDIAGELLHYTDRVNTGAINIRQAEAGADELIDTIARIAQRDRENTGLILIDYVQLLYQEKNDARTPRNAELKDICLALKDVARDYNLTIILAAQFNREVNAPHMAHMTKLADSADIERAAALVVSLWNGDRSPATSTIKGCDEYIAGAEIKPHTMHLRILKNRIGKADLWATYSFNGNNRFIGRAPLAHGAREPWKYIPKPKKETTESGTKEKTEGKGKETTAELEAKKTAARMQR
jgi:hypothetical protein